MRTISDDDIPDNVNYQDVVKEMRRDFLMVRKVNQRYFTGKEFRQGVVHWMSWGP